MDNKNTFENEARRFLLFLVAVFSALIIFVIVICIASSLTAVSSAAASRVESGMTKTEVVEILGDPHQIDPANTWHYSVRGCSDMLHVYFKAGKVDSANF